MEGALIEAATRAGIERIVKLSANGARPDNPVALMRWHAQGECTLEDSGLGHTVLRPQLYMQNFLRFGPSISAEGRFTAPMGDRRFAFVDVRDVARVAAAALLEEAHAGAAYVVSGPETPPRRSARPSGRRSRTNPRTPKPSATPSSPSVGCPGGAPTNWPS